MKSKLLFICSVLFISTSSVSLFGAGSLAPTPEKVAPLAVGERAPDVRLLTAEGTSVDLGASFKQKPTVLVFYKAGWCGLGNRELGELHANRSRFDELGYQIIAISTDKPADLHPTQLKHGLTYTLLSDSGLKAAPAYGVAYRAPDELIKSYAEKNITLAPIPGSTDDSRWLLVPTVFLVDQQGRIKWVHSSLKQNPALQDLLAAAELALK